MWRKLLATDEGVRFIILAARGTNTIEYELEFYYDMIAKVTYDCELTSYGLSMKLRDSYELRMREGAIGY